MKSQYSLSQRTSFCQAYSRFAYRSCIHRNDFKLFLPAQMEAKVISRNTLPSLKAVIIYLGIKIQPGNQRAGWPSSPLSQFPPQIRTTAQRSLQHYSISSDRHTAGRDLLVQMCILLRTCSPTASWMVWHSKRLQLAIVCLKASLSPHKDTRLTFTCERSRHLEKGRNNNSTGL